MGGDWLSAVLEATRHLQRSADVETVLFQCIALITFEVLNKTIPNFQGSRRDGWGGCLHKKLREKRLRIDWDISEKRKKMVEEVLFQCIALITFEVLNQTPPNFQGSRHNDWEWCLQNYKKNGR